MSNLGTLQASFQAAILAGDQRFRDSIRTSGRVSADTRLGIYTEAYKLRLVEALADNYPGLARLLGERDFEALASDYIDAHPSRFRSIRWFGDHLPEFISSKEDTFANRDILHEMALTDWRMGLAFDAADPPAADETDMARHAPDTWGALTFTFHPSVQRLDLDHDVIPFRLPDTENAGRPKRHPRRVPWLVWRQNLSVRYRSMEVDEAWAVDAAMTGEDFATLCGGITEWVDEDHAPMRMAGLLKRWLADGTILRIVPGSA